jgi:hypothetical protein
MNPFNKKPLTRPVPSCHTAVLCVTLVWWDTAQLHLETWFSYRHISSVPLAFHNTSDMILGYTVSERHPLSEPHAGLVSLFWKKIKGSLWDHFSVCVSVSISLSWKPHQCSPVYLYMYPFIIARQRLDKRMVVRIVFCVIRVVSEES